MGKYCTDWLCFMYMWRHNNDVIFINISVYVPPLNYLRNLYFGFFIFWKLTKLCHFVTYLLNDPRTLYPLYYKWIHVIAGHGKYWFVTGTLILNDCSSCRNTHVHSTYITLLCGGGCICRCLTSGTTVRHCYGTHIGEVAKVSTTPLCTKGSCYE